MTAGSLACPDWPDRLRAGQVPIADMTLDAQAADQALGVFDYLRLPDVTGQPAFGEAGGDWFREIVRRVYGYRDPATGARAIRKVFLLVPKKNAKTTNAAAAAITAMLLNRRPNAEKVVVGPTQKIAELCFDQAKGIIAADPEGYLPKRFHVRDHLKRIECRLTGAVLAIKTYDKRIATGAKPDEVILDELHVMSGMAGAEQVFGQLEGGMLPFEDAVMWIITTQSDTPPAGVFRQQLDYARRVRDGEVEDATVLPVLYEFPRAMQVAEDRPWRDPAVWPMVMPNLGRSITRPALKRAYATAREMGRAEEIRWASQHLNVEIGVALHADRWAGADAWGAAAEAGLDLETIVRRCDVVTVGIDGGGVDDLLGVAVMGRDARTRDWLLWARAWAHPIALERRPQIADRLRDFARDGHLTICEHPTQDVDELADLVQGLHMADKLPAEDAIGLDPYGVAAIVDAFAERGIPEPMMVRVGQGPRLSPAIWGMERKLQDGTLRHAGQPMLDWCVGNAKAETRGNAIYISKQASGKAKVDPLIAAFNSAMLMSRNPASRGRSYLASERLMVLR